MESIIQNYLNLDTLNSESDYELTRVELHHTLTAMVQLWHLCLQRQCTSEILKPLGCLSTNALWAEGAGCERTAAVLCCRERTISQFTLHLSLQLATYSEQMMLLRKGSKKTQKRSKAFPPAPAHFPVSLFSSSSVSLLFLNQVFVGGIF